MGGGKFGNPKMDINGDFHRGAETVCLRCGHDGARYFEPCPECGAVVYSDDEEA